MSPHFWINMAVVGWLSCVVIFWQILGNICLFCCPPALKRGYQTWLQAVWVGAVGRLMHPLQLVLTGTLPDPAQPSIFIVNHQVDADWWFMWIMSKHFHKHGDFKIILKRALKWLPVVGWGMQNFEFIFLHRNHEKDVPYLEKRVRTFSADRFAFWILLFPEGTTVHHEAIARSKDFAAKNDRPVLSQTLLPRVNGLAALLGALDDNVRIYDCTMVYSGYTGDIPTWDDGYERQRDKAVPSLRKLFTAAKIPPTHLHIEGVGAGEVKKRGIEPWLDERWREKDAVLAHYATTGQMPASIAQLPAVEVVDTGSLTLQLALALQPFLAALLFLGLWWWWSAEPPAPAP